MQFKVIEAFQDSTYLVVTDLGLSLKDGTIQDMKVRVIARLLSEGTSLVGDFDGDDSVGFRDFLMFAQAYGTTDQNYDLNGDGSVGFRDFLIFAQMYGTTADTSPTDTMSPDRR